jgi:diaminopimelate epimerase
MDIMFHKMHGTLNDFVVMQDLAGEIPMPPETCALICDRRRGVGGDGLIVVRPSEKADFFMDYRNADGSTAEMCGNGIRCLGKYVYDNGLTHLTHILVETRAGIKALELRPGPDGKIEGVRVNMGPPAFEPDLIPVKAPGAVPPIVQWDVDVGGAVFKASFVSMGNPHCVIFASGRPIEGLPQEFGALIENHPMFPMKTNVEFVEILNDSRIRMRVWERGSGETPACGTGACASAVAARLNGFVGERCTVELAGGDLDIEWNSTTNHIYMTGSACSVYVGTITI